MGRYRKLPVEIEARQWDGTPDGARAIAAWANGTTGTQNVFYQEGKPGDPNLVEPGEVVEIFTVYTLEGIHIVTPGDFIIQGVEGEFYPCKPGIFAQTYEEVPGAPES
jgi:hypothetical protein